MQYRASLKLNSSIFGGEKIRVLETKVANSPHDTLCLSFSFYLIGCFKHALKSDWLFFFNVANSLAGKKMRFEAKNGAIRE